MKKEMIWKVMVVAMCGVLTGCGDSSRIKAIEEQYSSHIEALEKQRKEDMRRIEEQKKEILKLEQEKRDAMRKLEQEKQEAVRNAEVEVSAVKKRAGELESRNKSLFWMIPVLIIGALAGGTYMGIKGRNDAKKSARSAADGVIDV